MMYGYDGKVCAICHTPEDVNNECESCNDKVCNECMTKSGACKSCADAYAKALAKVRLSEQSN